MTKTKTKTKTSSGGGSGGGGGGGLLTLPRTRVCVLHPDLGLGGAERLVVDMACELGARHSCEVDVYTAHHDNRRCFKETREQVDFKVHVRGNTWPRTILGGKCVALCAMIRMLAIAIHVALWCNYDVVLIDQVSVAILPFKVTRAVRNVRNKVAKQVGWAASDSDSVSSRKRKKEEKMKRKKEKEVKVVFYCHYPDQLLSTKRDSVVKRLYRLPLDWLEEWTTGMADVVLVNSLFTKQVFFGTFKRLARANKTVDVLYPAVELEGEGDAAKKKGDKGKGGRGGAGDDDAAATGVVFLSINRFERKKNIALAIAALKELHEDISSSPLEVLPRLVIAGGYDRRLPENVEYLEHLKDIARHLDVDKFIEYFPSFTDEQRAELLEECTCVLYTPEREHFGIVPLEAMGAGRPVIACNSGGPLETVVHQKTGFICEPTPRAFADAMKECMEGDCARRLGRSASEHVKTKFSRKAFGERLFDIINSDTM